jgi:exodeoxyribonuclease VII large subunit
MKTAAMRGAQRQARPPQRAGDPDAPPLAAHEERALIEAAAAGPLAAAPAGVPAGANSPEATDAETRAAVMAMGGTPRRPWTVAQVNACLNQLLSAALPPAFFVQGEISNFRTYDRGHAFFTLKDGAAELPCILWKDGVARLRAGGVHPKDGMAVIVKGAIRLYEPQGKIQIYVDTITPQGTGGLELAFRQLCDRLRAEGLFEPGRKRPLPRFPRKIVVITSRTGDVLHDVLTTAFRRYPGLHVLLHPVRVQGKDAAGDIVRAIEAVGRWNDGLKAAGADAVDMILLVRGGGSLEDLWPFNEEVVARAIVASRVPVATGIGHEPDTTIADLVGDLRGPTPTGITELTIPDARGLRADVDAKAALLTRDLRRQVELAAVTLDRARMHFETSTAEAVRNRDLRLDLLCRQIERIEPRHAIAQGWRRVEEAGRRLDRAMRGQLQCGVDGMNRVHYRLERCTPLTRIERHRDRVEHLRTRLRTALFAATTAAATRVTALAAHLRLVSPQAVLDRGFSITTTKDGTIVRSAGQVKKGDVLTTRLADGEITSTVGKPKQATLF